MQVKDLKRKRKARWLPPAATAASCSEGEACTAAGAGELGRRRQSRQPRQSRASTSPGRGRGAPIWKGGPGRGPCLAAGPPTGSPWRRHCGSPAHHSPQPPCRPRPLHPSHPAIVARRLTRVVALVATQVLRAGVEHSPDEGEDTSHHPEEGGVADTQDLAGALGRQAVVNLRQVAGGAGTGEVCLLVCRWCCCERIEPRVKKPARAALRREVPAVGPRGRAAQVPDSSSGCFHSLLHFSRHS